MRILISAGDVSGDVAGALLTSEILSQRRGVTVLGFGGARMAEAGARVCVSTSHLGVAGVTEIFRRVPEFIRVVSAIVTAVRTERPSLAVLIGNDLFSVLLGRWLRWRGVQTLSYFPPPTWMWGPLVRIFVNSFDVVLASFPDEYDIYSAASSRARVEFVGHYLADHFHPRTAADIAQARGALGLDRGARVVCLMPGSRQDEVQRLMPVLADAAGLMAARDATLRFLIPVADERYRGLIDREVSRAGLIDRADVVKGPNPDTMAAADLIILASGTASLEAALLGVPMIIVYKVSAITAIVARLFIRLRLIDAEMIGLPNLILKRMAVPELTQERAEGRSVADEATALLESPVRYRTMVADLTEAASRLAGRGALAHAARLILESAGHAADN